MLTPETRHRVRTQSKAKADAKPKGLTSGCGRLLRHERCLKSVYFGIVFYVVYFLLIQQNPTSSSPPPPTRRVLFVPAWWSRADSESWDGAADRCFKVAESNALRCVQARHL